MNNIKLKNTINNKINNGEKDFLIVKEKIFICNRQKTLVYVSLGKIISSYGVIALHLNDFWNFNLTNVRIWNIANFYQSLFYYSVPIFILSIGATLLNFNQKYGLLEYNKKRIVKVFIPLLGWNFILYLYKAYILNTIPKENFNFYSLWNYFFSSKVYHIFDSLHIFLLTYMLVPLVAFIEKSNKIRIYIYYFFILLVTQSIIPYIITLFGNKIIWIYNLNIGYLIYIFAGYIIHNYIFSKFTKVIIYFLGISSFFVDLIGTHVLTFKYKKIIIIHKGYLNLPCILYSCSLFLFLKEYCYLILKIINEKYINKLGSLTLGPFFMHLAIRETFHKFIKFNNLIGFNLIFRSLLLFLLCIFFSYVLKKIPLVKILVP